MGRYKQFSRTAVPQDQTNKKRWTPTVRNAHGRASVTREVYVHPLVPVTHSFSASFTPSPSRIITKRPSSIDIPLKKSIRVSYPSLTRPSIQTTGYIKGALVKKVPIHRTTVTPKHTVFDDSSSTQTAQVEATNFDDSWKPKRIPTVRPMPKLVEVNRNIKPIPFTRFSDTKVMRDYNPSDDQRDNRNMSLLKEQIKTDDRALPVLKSAKINSDNLSSSSVIDGPYMKFKNDQDKKQDTYILQPVRIPKRNIEGDSGIRTFNSPTLANQNSRPVMDIKELVKVPERLSPGVEYADMELEKTLTTANYESRKRANDETVSDSGSNKQTEVEMHTPHRDGQIQENVPRNKIGVGMGKIRDTLIYSDIHKILDKNRNHNADRKEPNVQHLHVPEDVLVLTANKPRNKNAMKSGQYIRYDDDSSVTEEISHEKSETRNFNGEKSHEIETTSNEKFPGISVPSKSNKVDAVEVKQPESAVDSSFVLKDTTKETLNPFNVGFTLSKTPFYGQILQTPTNKDYSREINEDRTYFPQIFPDSIRSYDQGKQNNTTKIHTSGQITKDNFVEKKLSLIEINPKETDKNINNITSDAYGMNRGSHFNQPKAVTVNDFSSLKSYSPTAPSLITYSSDNSDLRRPFDVIIDPKTTQDKKNRTTYILQRPPSLLPENPGTNRPRKPNVRLTAAMLAGILIAALIFLGFLTGTMVFAFHQIKFGTRRPKKDRHKKRTAVYAPEYLDENFSGNTYIHNNIFLPNPQNLEDRLSAEIDTTFSVDSEETAQATDNTSTSGNTRIKTAMQRSHDGDATDL